MRPRHCDAQGMLHAARYYECFEEAFVHWLTSVGLPYADLRATGIDLVIVESGCVHRQPARLDDDLKLTVVPSVGSLKSLSVTSAFRHENAVLATGRCTMSQSLPVGPPTYQRACVLYEHVRATLTGFRARCRRRSAKQARRTAFLSSWLRAAPRPSAPHA